VSPGDQPTWRQLYACLFFCLSSFLHLLSSPVRFLRTSLCGARDHLSNHSALMRLVKHSNCDCGGSSSWGVAGQWQGSGMCAAIVTAMAVA
jgi:hypothetical protein